MRNLTPFNRSNSSFDPFRMLDDFERDMRRFLDNMDVRSGSTSDNEFHTPACDVMDKDTHFVMSFDLPGIPKDEIKIDVRNGQLFVSGDRRSEKTEGGYSEKRYGHYERSITLPSNIDESNIEANYEDGVLYVALPKTEQSKRKEISISDSKKGIWQKLLGHRRDESKDVDVKKGGKAA